MDRRKFFKKTALSAAGISLVSKNALLANTAVTEYFGVHSFIEENPEAVFIMRTNVDVKTNGTAIYNTAKAFAESVLIPKSADDAGAVPVSNLIAIKPNLTLRRPDADGYTIEGTMGIVVDVNFTAGFVDRFKAFGIEADKIHLIETNYAEEDLTHGGYIQFAQDAGIHLDDYSAGIGGIDESKIVWKDVYNGGYYKKLPYIFPVNTPDSWLLNIAKLKAHSMGITGCAKNLQGTIVKSYQRHCYPTMAYDPPRDIPDVADDDLAPNRLDYISANYERHKNVIPRWDKPGRIGGMWQETWGTRCLDNNSVTKAGLHIVEGIYGRDGDFVRGPSLGDDNPDGLAADYMSNVVIFGKNPFHVDVIAHWIAGHEPGNFGLFHMAIERGLASILNPADIPLYEWKTDGTITETPLSDFPRTPLKTKYLTRDYEGQTETFWHLCNEEYDYTPARIENKSVNNVPSDYVLNQNYPNPFNPTTTISFSLKRDEMVNLTLYNARGRRVAVLINKRMAAGNHSYLLDIDTVNLQLTSGNYFYTLKTGNFTETKKMTVLK